MPPKRRPKEARKRDAYISSFGNAVSVVMKEHADRTAHRERALATHADDYRRKSGFMDYMNQSAWNFQDSSAGVLDSSMRVLARRGETVASEMADIARSYNQVVDAQFAADERLPDRVTPLVVEMAKARARR